jgi:hypothetical protein
MSTTRLIKFPALDIVAVHLWRTVKQATLFTLTLDVCTRSLCSEPHNLQTAASITSEHAKAQTRGCSYRLAEVLAVATVADSTAATATLLLDN